MSNTTRTKTQRSRKIKRKSNHHQLLLVPNHRLEVAHSLKLEANSPPKNLKSKSHLSLNQSLLEANKQLQRNLRNRSHLSQRNPRNKSLLSPNPRNKSLLSQRNPRNKSHLSLNPRNKSLLSQRNPRNKSHLNQNLRLVDFSQRNLKT